MRRAQLKPMPSPRVIAKALAIYFWKHASCLLTILTILRCELQLRIVDFNSEPKWLFNCTTAGDYAEHYRFLLKKIQFKSVTINIRVSALQHRPQFGHQGDDQYGFDTCGPGNCNLHR